MEKIDYKSYIDFLENNKKVFFYSFYTDLINIINNYKEYEKSMFFDILKKDLSDYNKDFYKRFDLDFTENPKRKILLSNYYDNINAEICSIDNIYKQINCYINFYNEKVNFLTIFFDYLEDDYYSIDINLINGDSVTNKKIIHSLGIKNYHSILLDQKSELNKFLYQINKLLN